MASIEALMVRNVTSVASDCPTRDALDAIMASRISCLLVCEDARPVGIVTERDLTALAARLLGGKAELPGTVGEVMSQPVISVGSHESLDSALALAEERGVRHLPVVDATGRLVGLLTQSDLLRAYTREIEQVVDARTAELRDVNRLLETQALQDGLLGIRNRRSMELDLDRMHAARERYGLHYAVVLCDVDHFKRYNDGHGHLAGDAVLRRVAGRVGEALRGSDSVYRYGGEELLVLLPEADAESALVVAERIRSGVETLAIDFPESERGVVTVSCGVASSRAAADAEASRGWAAIVQRADAAMYRAKAAGRNQSLADC